MNGADNTPPLVERRLHQYAGCRGFVWRWFIVGDARPFAFLSEVEALESLRTRPRPPGADRRAP